MPAKTGKNKSGSMLYKLLQAVVFTVGMLLVLNFAAEVNENAAYLDKDRHVLILAEVLAVFAMWKIIDAEWPWWGRLGGLLLIAAALMKMIEIFPEYRSHQDDVMCHEGRVCRKGIVLEDDLGKQYAVDENVCSEYNGRWLSEYQACDFNPPQP